MRIARWSLFAAFSGWLAAVAPAVIQGAQAPARAASPPQAPAQRAPAPQPPAAARTAATAESRAALDRYCVTCHNDRMKTAGLSLQSLDLATVPTHASEWEKVVRKLKTEAMPPPGNRRPDKNTYASLSAFLEKAIDRDAALHPNPGRTETVHRLNRAEYRNAVRDLLALDVDVAALLPTDDMSYGFDNIAGVLKFTPSLLDRYMTAARRVGRLAVGDTNLPVTADTFRLKSDLAQDDGFAALPVGTRGGTSITYQFPLDAEYVIKVEPLGGGADAHQLEVSVDGKRLQVFNLGARSGLGTGQGYDSEGQPVQVRGPISAGPHVVDVAFVKKSDALAESLREPFLAPHSEGAPRTQPAIGSVTIVGPYDAKGPGSTPSRQRIFICTPATEAAEPACAKRILSTLARRAYRRPATDADVATLMKFYSDSRAAEGFEGAIETALRRILVGPEFLLRVESDPAGAAPGSAYRVSDLELASRLSFFLWSSIPDDELLDAAIKGTLRKPGVLDQQVKRMLADARSDAIAENFAGQWLQLRTLEGTAPNEYLFPNFGENLRRDFRTETELFFNSMLHENRSVLEFLTADYTFLNERLAKQYGIPNVYGSHFRRVTIPDSNRRGFLGQGSFLTTTSFADRTTVVGRGKWILDNILASPPPSPPPPCPLPPGQTGVCVPPLKENQNSGKPLSLRERMSEHRDNPVCSSCHARMDPLGFALENFDATGQWRDTENNRPIDVSAVLPDGSKIEGAGGLRSWLVGQPDVVVSAITERLMTYALGRGIEYYDAPAVRKVVRDSAPTNYRFQSLILGIAKSTPFQMRKAQAADSH